MEKKEELAVILAAGGNPTAVFFVPDAKQRAQYVRIAKQYLRVNPKVEQVGFLENNRHLQMAGGEFCGNATRAAALLIAQRTSRKKGTFTVSGFLNRVRYMVRSGGIVTCDFPRFPFKKYIVPVLGGIPAIVVDLGGIVHVVLPVSERFNARRETYKRAHQCVVRELGLKQRAAVGVVWREEKEKGVIIHPVVWVRAVRSYFYETSCGSGTIATLLAGKERRASIVQPTGEAIYAEWKKDNTIILRSRVEIVSE